VIKKRFVIRYTDVFTGGYVRATLTIPGITIIYESEELAIKDATKFRFKWLANAWCKLLNYNRNDFKIFTVKEIN
jgi:hypothetical protein